MRQSSTREDGRSRRTHRLLAGLSLLTAGALLLSACTAAEDDGTDPATGTPDDQPAVPQELQVGIPTDINPTNFLGVLSANEPVGRLILEPVIDWDADAGEYVPWIASSWEFSEDRLGLTLTVRDDVVFHNGRALTAADVAFSINAAMAPDSGAQAGNLLKKATAVEAVDDATVQLTFAEPVGDSFLDALVWTRVVDEETVASLVTGDEVVGTGPFVWSGWTPGSTVELTGNADYWGGAPALESVTLRVIGQSQAMLAAIRSGEIDVAHRLVPRDVQTIADDPALRVETFDPFAEVYVGVDVTVPPFDDPKVRQALAWALDRERIADQVFSGYAEATILPLPPSAPGLDQVDTDVYSYDLEQARDLIAEAGADGATVSLAALSTDPILVAVRDIVQFNLTEIGLNVQAVSWDAAQVPENLGNGTTGGLWVNRVSSGSLSPGSMAATLLPYRPGKNASNVTDPAYAELAAAAAEGTPEANQAYADYLIEEAWHLTVVRNQNPLVVRDGVEGVRLDTNGYLDLSGTSIK